MHDRIKKRRGIFFLNTKMKADYYCRDTITALLKQMFRNGYYLPLLKISTPKLRHLAPLLFYSILILSGIFYPHLFLGILGIYLVTISIHSIYFSFAKKNIFQLLTFLIIPSMHFSYAIGMLIGYISKIIPRKKLTQDIIGWDIHNWSKSLGFWDRHSQIDFSSANGLELGAVGVDPELELGAGGGGLSLYFAKKGAHVLCTDIQSPEELASPIHQRYNIDHLIQYGDCDVLNLNAQNKYEFICFKSMLGMVGKNHQIDPIKTNEDKKCRKE